MEPEEHATPGRRRARTPLRTVALLLALVSATAGVIGLATADRGVVRRSATVAGLPVEVVRPAGAPGPLPGIVVAHGLAASRQIMRGFGDTLARRGYAVELVDLTGHGANTARLPGTGDGEAADERLDHDLDVAVAHLRALPGVDGGRIGLLGHSMGAAAVVRYAAAHPGIGATVAISQGSMAFTGSASRPRDLLSIAGGLEFAGFRDGAAAALHAAYPRGRPGTTYGDPRAGTARRAVVVGGVEHVGVLFDPLTHREAANWFDAAFGRTTAGDRPVGLRPVQRAGSALLLHLAAVLSFGAIAALLLGRGPRLGEGHGRVPVPVALGVPAIAVLAAIPVMAVVPRGWLPLAVAAPVAAFFGTVGVVCLAAVRLTGHGPGRGAGGRSWRTTAVAAVALVVLTVVSFAVPAELGWAHAVPVGPRAWTLIPITACTAAFFGGLEALCTGHDRRTAILIHVWTAAGALAGLCLAVFAGAAPSFVLLVAPLLAGLLVWQGVQAAALRANRAPRWLTALVGGVLLAWPIAVTMPIS